MESSGIYIYVKLVFVPVHTEDFFLIILLTICLNDLLNESRSGSQFVLWKDISTNGKN